ncbi:hypothetical protein M0Q50_06815 [bacterium]|jgi:hypothetical protein|nr:hypothetical protein [bacterium]
MKKEFDYLRVYRKFLWFHIEIRVVNVIFGDDRMEIFRETRDTYCRKYGYDNVLIEMCWNKESYNGKGVRI